MERVARGGRVDRGVAVRLDDLFTLLLAERSGVVFARSLAAILWILSPPSARTRVDSNRIARGHTRLRQHGSVLAEIG